jgi:hypothetical protein
MKGVVVLVVSVIIVAALVMLAANGSANFSSADFGSAADDSAGFGSANFGGANSGAANFASAIQPVAAPYGTGALDTVDTSQEDSARALGAAVLANHLAAQRPVDLECPDEGVPCPQDVVWRNTFPGCGSFHIPVEGKDYFRDDRLWQGDLNPKIQARYALMGKQWDPYEYMDARQAWLQFIATNNSTQSDKYMRAVDDLTDVDATRVTDIEPVPVF